MIPDRRRTPQQRLTVIHMLNRGGAVELYQLMADVAKILTELARTKLNHDMTTAALRERIERLEDFTGLGTQEEFDIDA